MRKSIYILIALIGLSSISFGQSSNSKIEIYLLKEFVKPDKNSSRFWADIDDLKDKPIIQDNEILGYDTLTYEISIDTSVCKKLRGLKPSLSIGIQFVLTLDKIPILTGYFWNPVSSFGCDWYVIQNICVEDLKISKGGPEHLNRDIPELRNDERLVQAIIQSDRLMNFDSSKAEDKSRQDTVLVLDNIFFDFGTCNIHHDSYKILDSLTVLLQSYNYYDIKIIRYEFLSPEFSMHPAKIRADNIKTYLIENGLENSISAIGITNTGQEISNNYKDLISRDRNNWTIIQIITTGNK